MGIYVIDGKHKSMTAFPSGTNIRTYVFMYST